MRVFAIPLLAVAIAAPAAAIAQSGVGLPVVPTRAGSYPNTAYDQGGREKVTYDLDRSGGYVRGVNAATGARWNAEVSATGAMKGVDADGNHWRYDPWARVYYNQTTGRSCAAASVRRVCPS